MGQVSLLKNLPSIVVGWTHKIQTVVMIWSFTSQVTTDKLFKFFSSQFFIHKIREVDS